VLSRIQTKLAVLFALRMCCWHTQKAEFPKADRIFLREQAEAKLAEYWEDAKNIIRRWDLLHDDLEKQPQEVAEFPDNLLK
jgi:hypothetical protein